MMQVHDERLATSFQPFVSASTKSLYRIAPDSHVLLGGVTDAMCTTHSKWAREKMTARPKKKGVGSLTW